MAIKLNGSNIIDDARTSTVPSIQFADGTSLTTMGSSIGEQYGGIASYQHMLDIPVIGSGGFLGRSVSASGNYAIVSATSSLSSETYYVYICDITSGKRIWVLTNPDAYISGTSAGDSFGISVAISGNYAMVGAQAEDESGGTSSGKVYVYNVTTGQLIHTLNNPNYYGTVASDVFGNSVAISGNYAIVGAYLEDDAGGTDSGKVYVYDITTGALVWVLNNPNYYGTSTTDYFGASIGISGNYAIVGSSYEDDAGGADSGKAYIFNVTTGQLVWTLTNPNYYQASTNDYFGAPVAISGNYIAVGATGEDDSGGTSSGKVYVYNVTTGQLIWKFDNPNIYPNIVAPDTFGRSISISGNYIAIGSQETTGQGIYQDGVVYVFNLATGEFLWSIINPNDYVNNTSGSDNFGSSVAISGNYVIVGASGESSASGSNGRVYVYTLYPINDIRYVEEIEFTNGLNVNFLENKAFQPAYASGQLTQSLKNPNVYGASLNDSFGISVAISGNYAIISAYGESDAGGASSGKAYIFNVNTGQLVWTLTNPNYYGTSAGDFFGYSVAISGNYAIVGTINESDAGGVNSGKAYIYNVTTGALVWVLNNPNYYGTSDTDYFGYSVAISGNYAIVGAYPEDDSGGSSSGKAYIFNVTTGALVWALNNPNAYSTSASDNFGLAVAISGNYAIVGAYGEDFTLTDSGVVYVYKVSTGQLLWTLVDPNYYGTTASDYFGVSVAISGNYAIVGANQEDDSGGLTSGKVYIYDVARGTLIQTLNNPNAYSTSAGDTFGYSVAISGNYAIVGSVYEDDVGGSNSGKAYIYNVTTGALLNILNNPNAYSTSDSDNFGYSVAISGNYAIVGAYLEDDAGGTGSGRSYIYSVTDQTYLDKIVNVGNSIY